MELISPIHGKMIYEENEIIYFEKESPFNILQSIEDKELGFIIISPFFINDKYEIKLNDEVIKNLNLGDSEDVMLYSIVTLNSKAEEITANLKAPLVINIKNRKGEQYISDKEVYNIKEKVFK